MSNDNYYSLNARFTEITPLSSVNPINGNTPHQFTLKWTYPALDVDDERPLAYRYDINYIRIFRYIGSNGECINPYDIPSPSLEGVDNEEYTSLKLIIEASQVNNNIIIKKYTYLNNGSYYTTSETRTNQSLSDDFTEITDDLTEYYNSSTRLRNAHDINDASNDKQILNEIYTTERPIVYQIATYIGEVEDFVPYIITPYTDVDVLGCYSSKTQVRHDVLHYEFDTMWLTKLSREYISSIKSISRTAMDIDALHRSATKEQHRYPTGRGGFAWVSCRGEQGEIFRLNLSNGVQCGVSQNIDQASRFNTGAPAGFQSTGWGHGITVDINNGNCWSGACQGKIRKITGSTSNDQQKQILPNISIGTAQYYKELITSGSSSYSIGNWPDSYGYDSYTGVRVDGRDVCPSQGTRRVSIAYYRRPYYVNDNTISENVLHQCGIFGAINNKQYKNWISFCIKECIATKQAAGITGTISESFNTMRTATLVKVDPSPPCSPSRDWTRTVHWGPEYNPVTIKLNTYGSIGYNYDDPGRIQWVDVNNDQLKTLATLVPNQATTNPYCINVGYDGKVFTVNETNNYYNHNNNTINISELAGSDRGYNGTGITSDLPYLPPNINNVFNESGNDSSYKVIHCNNNYVYEGYDITAPTTLAELNAGQIIKGVEIDDSNNVIGLGSSRIKIYRMNDDDIFPTGQNCRYPSISLEDQPFSVTNTREIEWFLTRDHYEMTDDAREAWCELVQFNRFEAVHDMSTGMASNINDDISESRCWHPKHSNGLTNRYGIRINPTYYNLDDESVGAINTNTDEIVGLIREWAENYTTPIHDHYIQNRTGRLLHPNAQHNTGSYWYGGSGTDDTYKISIGEISITGDYKRLEKESLSGTIDAYNQFTTINSTPIGEILYNYDLIHPEITLPTVYLNITGDSLLNFKDEYPQCYEWPYYTDNSIQGESLATKITAYDDLSAVFLISADPGTFIIRELYLDVDDYPVNEPITIGDWTHELSINNSYNESLANYETTASMEYMYNDPSIGGRIYIDPEFETPYQNQHEILPRKTKVLLYNDGVFKPTAWTAVKDVYSNIYTGWKWGEYKGTTIYNEMCLSYNHRYDIPPLISYPQLSSKNYIEVYERWPEPRFFFPLEDRIDERKWYFETPSYLLNDLRYNKEDYIFRLSNINDAVRKDVLIAVDPFFGDMKDRSITRSFPISSWNIQISSDNIWASIHNISVTGESVKDTQSLGDTLTTMYFPYGTNIVSLCTESLSASTISDRIFSQCINVKEMEPFAYYDIISAQTVSGDFTEPYEISDYYMDINPEDLPNDVPTAYISGYAPYLKVCFKDMSWPHTFPISSYHWNFGDIYNEGGDIYDPSSNYYTYSASEILNGNFGFNVEDKIPWVTDGSNRVVYHTYVMPGKYRATLTVKASTTNTSDSYSKSLYAYDDLNIDFDVEVIEISATCGTVIGGLSADNMSDDLSNIKGQSPLTAYFSMSGFKPGSFAPCQVKWHFNDHIETINKYPPTLETSQGLPISINNEDLTSTVVPYILDTTDSLYHDYSIGLEIVMCNTNTTINCASGLKTGKIDPAYIGTLYHDLLKNRIDEKGNVIYTFYDTKHNVTHTVMLTGELNDI